MEQWLALVAFSFVSAVTPGPNNVLLWASGASFGARRTVPHILGTAVGIGIMALGVAAGLGALLTTVPGLAVAMKAGGSVYLLYLAYRLLAAETLERGSLAKPLGIVQAAAFQVINPKGWIFALGAITTFRPADLPVPVGVTLVTATMMLVILPSASIWAVGGDALGRWLADARVRRVVSVILAALVAATVVLVWI